MFDIAIVGGGIVGMATAYKLSLKHPDLQIVLLEKEPVLADHQTGNNSGVIHSGIYYIPGSSKAENCRNGRHQLVAFAQEHGIPHDICGKIILATTEEEVGRLKGIYTRGKQNQIEGIKLIDDIEIAQLEPHAVGLEAIHVPCTGIIDFRAAVNKMAELFLKQGKNQVKIGWRLEGITKNARSSILFNGSEKVEAARVIFCGGLQADRLAKLDGLNPEVATVPFRGDYYELTPQGKHKVKNLIYPVPDPAFPFLGVHFTRMTDGSVECGPNAVFGFKREGYNRTSFDVKDTSEALAFSGTWRLFAKHWRMGLHEQQRAWSKKLFLEALKKLIPSLEMQDIKRARSGVRAMTLKPNGAMVDDFLFLQQDRHLHVLNAPSPAATACLAIADNIINQLDIDL